MIIGIIHVGLAWVLLVNSSLVAGDDELVLFRRVDGSIGRMGEWVIGG